MVMGEQIWWYDHYSGDGKKQIMSMVAVTIVERILKLFVNG